MSHKWRISLTILRVYSRHLPKPEPDPKPGFGGFPNPKPGFGKKAPGLESLVSRVTLDTARVTPVRIVEARASVNYKMYPYLFYRPNLFASVSKCNFNPTKYPAFTCKQIRLV